MSLIKQHIVNFIFLFLVSNTLYSQSQIEGVIMLNNSPKEYINITNNRTKINVLTDENGVFNCTVKKGDTLKIHSITIKNILYVIAEDDLLQGEIRIEVESETYLLNNIVLSDFNMFKKVQDTTSKINMHLPFNTNIIKRTIYERQIIHEKSKSIGFFGIPVIKNSKAIKKLERTVNVINKDKTDYSYFSKLKQYISVNTLKKWNITEEEFHRFYDFCIKDDEFYKSVLDKNILSSLALMKILATDFNNQEKKK